MKTTDSRLFPLPRPVIERYARGIFTPILLGECATTVWVASAGRRLVNKFIIENIDHFSKILPNPEHYLLVYIEPLDLTEESLSGYLRLIGSTLKEACLEKGLDSLVTEEETEVFEDEAASYTKLLTALTSFVRRAINSGLELVLFLGEFDELSFIDTLFCNNLRSLWSKFDSKLHYVFLIKDTNMVFERSKIGEDLAENFLQNVVYFPLSGENSDYLIDRFSQRLGYRFSEAELRILNFLCDSHPYFLKVATSLFAKNKDSLSETDLSELVRQNYELRAVARRIIDVQTDKAKEVLKRVTTDKVSILKGEEEKVLELLGIVKKGYDGNYHPFCGLFADAILERVMPKFENDNSDTKLVFDDDTGTLLWDGKPIEEKFTPQEYEVLLYLMKEPNKLRNRDEIGEVLWGKDSYDKYSDWAIDQLVSKLRKKLDKLGISKKTLTTIRGRGYKLVL